MEKFQDVASIIGPPGLIPVVGVNVTVYNHGTSTQAAIFSDNSSTVTGNPLTTDSSGRYSFYAADGRYDLTVSGAGIQTTTLTDIVLQDPNSIVLSPNGVTIHSSASFAIEDSTGVVGPTIARDVDGSFLITREIRMQGVGLYGWNQNNATNRALAFDTPSDTNNRFSMDGNGLMNWGPGNAALDTQLSRSGVSQLTLTGSLLLGLGGIRVTSTGINMVRLSESSSTGYSGITHAGTGTQNYTVGMGGPSEAALGVANKFFVYDGLAGQVRATIDSTGAFYIPGNLLVGTGISKIYTVGLSDRIFINASNFDMLGIIKNTGLGIQIASSMPLSWASTSINAASDLMLFRDGSNILAQKNGNNANTIRMYSSQASSTFASFSHDGTNTVVSTQGGGLQLSASTMGFYGVNVTTKPGSAGTSFASLSLSSGALASTLAIALNSLGLINCTSVAP